MATNNDGIGGVKLEHVALEQTTLIGMQSPNIRPAVRESSERVKIPTIRFKDTTGTFIKNEPVYDCEMIDNSWLAYGGKYTLGVGNKWHARVGSGGIYFESSGPFVNDTEIMMNNVKKGFFIQTKLFQTISTERTMLSGKRLDIDFDECHISGNTTFTNNVLMNGGLYVNGELMANHLTMQGQKNLTEYCDIMKGFINPNQSFHVFQGQSLAATMYTPKSLLGTIFEGLDVTDADDNVEWIEAEMTLNTDFISQIIPGLDKVGLSVLKFILCLPIKLKFPKGISLISDATNADNPAIYTTLKMQPRIVGDASMDSDLYGPGHQHEYSGPAISYIEDTLSMYNEGKKITQTTPLEHKQCNPCGAESIDAAIQQCTEMATKYVKEYVAKQLQFMIPTWARDYQ